MPSIFNNSKTLIHPRNLDAISGSQFAQENLHENRSIRESKILDEITSGNIPNFLRHFVPININSNGISITYMTMPNYIALGSDDDYLLMPTNAATAQKICDAFDCTLPTKQMVDQIWSAAINKLEPIPHGPPYDDTMMSTERYVWSDTQIKHAMGNKDITKLTAGHKKDIILTNHLSPNNLHHMQCIYGWHHLNGTPIQGKNYFSHELTYCDYAGCIRLIANDIMVNGTPARIQDVFKDPSLAKLISDEGVLTFLRY